MGGITSIVLVGEYQERAIEEEKNVERGGVKKKIIIPEQ